MKNLHAMTSYIQKFTLDGDKSSKKTQRSIKNGENTSFIRRFLFSEDDSYMK